MKKKEERKVSILVDTENSNLSEPAKEAVRAKLNEMSGTPLMPISERLVPIDEFNIDYTEAEVSDEVILYDANAVQKIPLSVPFGEDVYKIYHCLKPLSPARYIQFEKDIENSFKDLGEVSTDIFEPKKVLGLELIENAEGYEPPEDWQTLLGLEIVQSVNALLFCEIAPKTFKKTKQGGFNPNADAPVYLKVLFSGADLTTAIFFRPPTQDEVNSFYKIDSDKTDNNQLASHAKKPKAQRLYELGAKMVTRSEGYEGKPPIFHVAKACEQHFLNYHSRVGKF